MVIELGNVVMTSGVNNLVNEEKITMQDIVKCVARHSNCDFGELNSDDVELQNYNIENNIEDRVMSIYKINEIKLWIITEWDRSYTTILLPDEY